MKVASTDEPNGIQLVIVGAPGDPVDPAMVIVQSLCDRMLAIVNEAPGQVSPQLMMTAVRYTYTTVAQAFGYELEDAIRDIREGFSLTNDAERARETAGRGDMQ